MEILTGWLSLTTELNVLNFKKKKKARLLTGKDNLCVVRAGETKSYLPASLTQPIHTACPSWSPGEDGSARRSRRHSPAAGRPWRWANAVEDGPEARNPLLYAACTVHVLIVAG